MNESRENRGMDYIIYPGYGLQEFRDKVITRDLVIESFGEPDNIVDHGHYSREMKYNNGLRFYYLQKDEVKSASQGSGSKKQKVEKDSQGSPSAEGKKVDPPIVLIGFRPPFPGRTEEGIILNKSKMRDVFQIYGKENWLTTKNDKFWWVEYSGIAFYVERDLNENPYLFDEEKYLRKTIVRITVPLREREEDAFRNEDGEIIRSIEDFCIDGKDHSPIFDEERAEEICSKCGLVLSERMISIDLSGQRAFSAEERNKREQHGTPVNALIPDLQMATTIDRNKPMPARLKKAVKWDSRYTWKQRNMILATSEIKRIGELLNIPQYVKENAIRIYRKAFQKGLLKGRSIKAMVAASLYYACGDAGVPRTLNEIVASSNSDFHDVTKSYQVLIKELNLKSPALDPNLLVSKYVADLSLGHEIEVLASSLISDYKKFFSLSGKDPKGLVAAALYLAAQKKGVRISQTKISKAVGITEVTLRNRLREMQRITKKKRSKKVTSPKKSSSGKP